MKQFVIGIDIGGTNIKIGLINKKAEILFRLNLKTKTVSKNTNQLVEGLATACLKVISENHLEKNQILGVGIGLPGLVDIKHNIVYSLTNIKGWKNVPLKKIIEKKIGIPVFIDNDVNVIALAEWTYGAGKGAADLICMTLGTGVGGGLILNNAIYRGPGFAAGELGHTPLNEKGKNCNCGGFACMETVVGNQYLEKKAKRFLNQKDITLEQVTALANKGNKKAVLFWEQTAEHISNGLIGVVNTLNPSLILVGGGVAEAYKYIFPVMRQVIKKRAMHIQGRMVRIKKTTLGQDAGIIGSQVLVLEMLGAHQA
ncbi:MAG: ROK family protein [Candidatus Omnitrophica bacterium]|nr:ROK family protein [Candidatus Omnitrophota bacterium]